MTFNCTSLWEIWLFYKLCCWSTKPTGSDHYFHTECPSVRPYVRPKNSKSSDNHCRPGLWADRVDHWSCFFCFGQIFKSSNKTITCLGSLKVHVILSANSQSRPAMTINFIFTPVVRPYFSKYRITKQTSVESNYCYSWDCGSGRVDHW